MIREKKLKNVDFKFFHTSAILIHDIIQKKFLILLLHLYQKIGKCKQILS